VTYVARLSQSRTTTFEDSCHAIKRITRQASPKQQTK
jgi:hypothetical protein